MIKITAHVKMSEWGNHCHTIPCTFNIRHEMIFVAKAMPNWNSVKRPRARRFGSPQSDKKTNCVGEIFFNNFDVP